MKPHEERVVVEERELDVKLNALGVFIHGAVFATLPDEDQRLLQAQEEFMRGYLGILRQRIERFKVS